MQLQIANEADKIAEKRYNTNVETFMIGKISTLDLNDSQLKNCLLYTSPSPRDRTRSRMPSSA